MKLLVSQKWNSLYILLDSWGRAVKICTHFYFRVGVSMNVVGTIAPQVFKENHTNIYYFYPQNRILADLKKLHSQYEILKKTVINELFRINRSLARLLIKIWQITINYNLNLSSFLFNRSFWSLLDDWRGHFSNLIFI